MHWQTHTVTAMGAWVYMLHCRDGSYHVGSTRSTIEQRVSEHNTGHYGGYTSSRRPVSLVFSEHFDRIEDAIAAERRIKGWRREKKEALAHGDFARLSDLARGYARKPHPSTGSG